MLSRQWIKRGATWFGYAAAVLLVVFVVDGFRSSDIEQRIPEQSATLIALDGTTHDILKQSQQQPVMLYFWATWCPYCKVVSPMVDGVAEDHPVLSIAFSSGSNAKVSQFIQQNGYQFATVNDETGVLARRWGVSVTPAILVISKGKVVSATTGLTTSIGMRARLNLAR